jgi:hypothetical protein
MLGATRGIVPSPFPTVGARHAVPERDAWQAATHSPQNEISGNGFCTAGVSPALLTLPFVLLASGRRRCLCTSPRQRNSKTPAGGRRYTNQDNPTSRQMAPPRQVLSPGTACRAPTDVNPTPLNVSSHPECNSIAFQWHRHSCLCAVAPPQSCRSWLSHDLAPTERKRTG